MFSFYYTDRVIKFSLYNNTILASIDEYASLNDKKCIEGSINNDGIVLGLSGLVVDKNKSYSNMKGNGFKEELIEFEKEKCILTKENNLDKYIISGNEYNNNISLVIDVINKRYYKNMINVLIENNIPINLLVDETFNGEYNNIVYKGNKQYLKDFNKKYKEFYCTDKYNIINDCKTIKKSSIRIINYIDKNLYTNTKKLLNKGYIIFIKESNQNLNELTITINYIKSRGYNIVSINELLS